MDTKELRQKTDKEVNELVSTLREQLRHFRFETAADAMKQVREIREAKKTIARALTVAGERAREAAKKIIASK
jgi:ribosomal protein L29